MNGLLALVFAATIGGFAVFVFQVLYNFIVPGLLCLGGQMDMVTALFVLFGITLIVQGGKALHNRCFGLAELVTTSYLGRRDSAQAKF